MPRSAFTGYRGPAISIQRPAFDAKAYAAQQEAARQADIRARAEAAQLLAQQKADQEASRIKAVKESEALKQAAALALQRSHTNAAWNLMLHKVAEAEKAKPVTITDTDAKTGQSIKRTIPYDQFVAEKLAKNAPEIAKLTAEKEDMTKNIAAGDNRFGLFNLFSRPNRLAEIDAQLAQINPPNDLIAQKRDVAGATAAELAQPIQTRAPTSFNGTTSLSGPGFAPVQSSGFIGTPGGENSFSMDPQVGTRSQFTADSIAANMPAIEARDVIQDAPPIEFRGDPGAAPTIPKTHIAHLLANPDTAADFEKKYGTGSAAQYLDPIAEEP